MHQGSDFERKTTRLSGGSMDYFVAGTGPDVVCVHGASGFAIRAVPLRLRQRFRVWLPILPGYEGTPRIEGVDSVSDLAGLLAEFIDAQIGRRCELVGHGMGARIAAWLAIRHPSKVEQLVMMAPGALRRPGAPALDAAPEAVLRQLYAHPERQPPETRSAAERESDTAAARRYGSGPARDEALLARLPEIAAVTLILGGSKDPRAPAEAVQAVKSALPRANLIYVYDAAHMLEVDQPERVASLVEDFFVRGDAFVVNPGKVRVADPA